MTQQRPSASIGLRARVIACMLTACTVACSAEPAPTPPRGAPQNALVILQYHFVSAQTPRSTSLDPEEFEAHLDILEAEDFEIVDLPSALATLRAGGTLPPRAAAITFDDGYTSVYTEAMPRLVARDMPFTVFVNPGAVDVRARLNATWEQLAEMQAAGATIANHGMHHDLIARRDPRLPPETEAELDLRMRAEVLAAEDRIEAELGVRHQLFAFPYGEYDHRIRAWLADHGYIGIGQHSGVVFPGSDFLALPRFPFSGSYADPEAFTEKVLMGALPILDADSLPDPTTATQDERPPLRFRLDTNGLRGEAVACYASGQGRMDIRLEPADDGTLDVVATPAEPLPLGRSRYNCTAPTTDGRWLWFSQPWLRLGPDGQAPI